MNYNMFIKKNTEQLLELYNIFTQQSHNISYPVFCRFVYNNSNYSGYNSNDC